MLNILSASGIHRGLVFFALLALAALALAQPTSEKSTDAYEPNNDIQNAAALPLLDPFTIQLDNGDQDWFVLDANTDGLLMFHFEIPLAEPLPSVTLFKLRGDEIENLDYSATDASLYVARLEKGRYLLNIQRSDARLSQFTFRANFIEGSSARNTGRKGNVFVLGMELAEAQLQVLNNIADMGQAKMIEVSSTTTNLTLVLASIAEESRGNVFDSADFMSTILDQVFTNLRYIREDTFTKDWLGQQLVPLIAYVQRSEDTKRGIYTVDSLADLLTKTQQTVFQQGNQAFDRSYVASAMNNAMVASMPAVK